MAEPVVTEGREGKVELPPAPVTAEKEEMAGTVAAGETEVWVVW